MKAPLNGHRAVLIPGDRIQGDLAKPDGAGPFPAVIGLHGCAGMHDTTKRKLVDELVAWGYVILLVDSYATRGIDQACTGGVCHLRQAQAGCLWGSRLLGSPNLRRSTTCGCGRLLGRRLGYPLGGGDQFVRTVRPSKQLAVPGGGCVLSSMSGWQGHVRGYPRSFSLGPSTIGRRRQTVPIKPPAGATTGHQSSWLSIPARTMDFITRTSSPAGRCSITGWNTTARRRTMQSRRLHQFLDRHLN